MSEALTTEAAETEKKELKAEEDIPEEPDGSPKDPGLGQDESPQAAEETTEEPQVSSQEEKEQIPQTEQPQTTEEPEGSPQEGQDENLEEPQGQLQQPPEEPAASPQVQQQESPQPALQQTAEEPKESPQEDIPDESPPVPPQTVEAKDGSPQEEIPEEPDESAATEQQTPPKKKKPVGSPGMKSSTSGISHADMRARTAIAASTVDGVLKRTTFMSAVSAYPAAPKFSIASRGAGSFMRSSSTPAPGSYSNPELEKSKFKAGPRFSFGSSARFGLGPSPLKLQPGPGAYEPRDPTLNIEPKVGFGSSKRTRGAGEPEPNPGPGAYEVRSTVGDALMFTARGRQPTSYMKARSQPGPGAYTPKDHYVVSSTPKCGFGTSTREELASRVSRLASLPGPGAYELHTFKTIGKDSLKFSATSRRRMHDISSYTSPGPGAYNAHVTQFGDHAWPGANVP